MPNGKRIPALPSLQGIQDEETRKALQAVVDGLNVRNGQTRDDGAAFVTREELDGYLTHGNWNFVAGNRNGLDGDMARAKFGGITGAFQALINKIIGEIQNSALWKRLSANIDKLDGPNGALAKIGLMETGIKRYESVTDTKIETINGILVKPDGTTLAAIVEQNLAETADGLARTLSQTTLQTMANGGSILAQEALQISQPTSVEGTIDASWTVKFDANGYVAGAGLGLEGKDGTYTSQFLVRADRFAVGSPTTADLFPFIVDTVGGSPVIAMNGQVYIGATPASTIAANASVAPITYIGAFASPPSTTSLKKNNVYRNTMDGNSYILSADGGTWGLYLEKGSTGATGATGAAGSRGSMTLYASGSAWSDSTANTAITNTTGSSTKVIGDTVTISNGSSFAATKYWSGLAWVSPGVVIDGNLLVSGTISASKIAAGLLSGFTFQTGTGHTINNKAFEVTSNGAVYADNLFGGVAIFDNYYYATGNAVLGYSSQNNYEAIAGYGSLTGGACHGVRGKNTRNNAAGLIGGANGYDFYADGSGTNYGPFTGTHDGLVSKGTTLTVGDIVTDVQVIKRNGVSNTLCQVAESYYPNQRGVIGVVAASTSPLAGITPSAFIGGFDPDTHQPIVDSSYESSCAIYDFVPMNALGEGQINVCGEGGDLSIGDLIVTSSMPGKGMAQVKDGEKDDVIRSYTVAKCRENVKFDFDGQVKMVACIYLCG